MRWLWAGFACLALAGCSKAPDRDRPGETAVRASGVAFAYRYDFCLPSSRIADAQEAHAQACEQLASRRITSMTYRLDETGQVSASLDLLVASPITRAVGRNGVKGIETAGGALTGAEITGTDAAATTQAATTAAADAATDRDSIDRQLARGDLTQAARSDLTTRRAELLRTQRESTAAANTARESVATTPIGFTYSAGTGVGLTARASEAAHDALVSLTWTITTALTLVAYLAPPLMLLLLVALFWHWIGRRWWARAFPVSRID